MTSAAGRRGLAGRVPLPGSPNNILLNKAQDKLYVAQDNSDSVAVIDTEANTVLEQIDAIAPAGLLADQSNRYTGAATNNLTFVAGREDVVRDQWRGELGGDRAARGIAAA